MSDAMDIDPGGVEINSEVTRKMRIQNLDKLAEHRAKPEPETAPIHIKVQLDESPVTPAQEIPGI
jgi:hypothetical protein